MDEDRQPGTPDAHAVQIAQLEKQVRLLAAGLDLPVNDPRAVIPRDAIIAARTQKLAPAVKLLRDLVDPKWSHRGHNHFLAGFFGGPTSGLSLLEAKRIIDAAAQLPE